MSEKGLFSKNIKYLREKDRKTQEELALSLGKKSFTSVSDWERGKSVPNAGTLSDIAKMYSVSIDDLMERDISLPAPNIEIIGKTKRIPIIGQIACGDPITADENVVGYLEELASTLPTGNLFALKTVGDSMTPTIPEGGNVIIREQPDVEDGEIAAVLVNDDEEATLKRVKRQGDVVMLLADNPAYPPYIVTEENPARILGKAVKVSFDL